MPNDGELVDLFAAVTADAALRQAVLVDNPTRLYWS
jgi:2-pyrone-4,6-dicarboxylate lactonase